MPCTLLAFVLVAGPLHGLHQFLEVRGSGFRGLGVRVYGLGFGDGKESGNHYNTLVSCRDNGKEDGNYLLGFRA